MPRDDPSRLCLSQQHGPTTAEASQRGAGTQLPSKRRRENEHDDDDEHTAPDGTRTTRRRCRDGRQRTRSQRTKQHATAAGLLTLPRRRTKHATRADASPSQQRAKSGRGHTCATHAETRRRASYAAPSRPHARTPDRSKGQHKHARVPRRGGGGKQHARTARGGRGGGAAVFSRAASFR